MNWKALTYHPVQSALWRSTERFPIVCAGRGSGKSELAKRRVVRYLPVIKPWPDPIYFYALPTYAQARRVAWDSLKSLIPREWIKGEPKESSMIIETIFGSKLYLLGMDNPARIEGVQWDGGVYDEYSDQKPKSFDLSVRPALSHKNAWCWRIGVPKRTGPCASEFKDVFESGKTDDDPDVKSYHWTSEEILPEAEIVSAKRNLSEDDYNEQYRASWETSTGLVNHAFSNIFNVSDQVTYKSNSVIIVGSDFNVNPMCWCLSHVVDGRHLVIFDEIKLRDTNTQATLDYLYEKYGSHDAGWAFIGDASARARNTRAAKSDFIQIYEDKRFINKKVIYDKSNPPIADRVAAVNALLCNVLKERRCKIHPRCVTLIKDLESLAYKPGTREIQVQPDMGHMYDAFGYIVYKLFPIRISQSSQKNVVVSHG